MSSSRTQTKAKAKKPVVKLPKPDKPLIIWMGL